jgi:hypothetical protein
MKESYWESMNYNAIILQNNKKSVNERGFFHGSDEVSEGISSALS